MILLGLILLLLHRGDSLVPVILIQVGEPATISCALPKDQLTQKIYWYKQSAGNNLELIVILLKFTTPTFSRGTFESRVLVKADNDFSNLTILEMREEDEGMYHCACHNWIKNVWSGTYLLVQGNSKRTSNYTVVQPSSVSGPVSPGDSMTLQCSVLSDRENKSCPGGPSVFWFRAGSDGSHPDVMYTDGSSRDGCGESSEPQRSCVYGLSKTFSSFDAGTYYCAVATCGRILIGPGQEVVIEEKCRSVSVVEMLLTGCLLVSVVGNVVLFCKRKQQQHKGSGMTVSQGQTNARRPHETMPTEEHLSYAALDFSARKSSRGRKRENSGDTVYAQVKT